MIIIEPFGGLANRMRVIASGLWLQEKTGCKLICLWSENSALKAPFDLLFQNIDGLVVQQRPKKYKYLKSTKQKTKLKQIISKFINKLLGVDYYIREQDCLNLNWIKEMDVFYLHEHGTIYIKTCEEFGDNYLQFRRFKPVDEILNKIVTVEKQFGRNTIGLHIRRTDNIESINSSPLELFIKRIITETNKNKDIEFYLSTDDMDVEQELVAKFGERIIVNQKEFSRLTVKGMQDAVVDMFCLSKTSIIYGSYWSSFSDIASRIGNIDFLAVKQDN